MKQKYYKKDKILDIDENFNFVEEVPINEVKPYDFEDPKEDKKFNFIIVIIGILALSLFAGGLYYAFIRPDPKKTVNFESGDLFVVHSSVTFGQTIDSFINYVSEEKSSRYTFYVENKNEAEISYKVQIEEQKVTLKSGMEKSALNYSLIKNNKEIANGKLSDIDKVLTTTKIEKEATDYFEFRIWSDFPSKKYYKYQIEIVE